MFYQGGSCTAAARGADLISCLSFVISPQQQQRQQQHHDVVKNSNELSWLSRVSLFVSSWVEKPPQETDTMQDDSSSSSPSASPPPRPVLPAHAGDLHFEYTVASDTPPPSPTPGAPPGSDSGGGGVGGGYTESHAIHVVSGRIAEMS